MRDVGWEFDLPAVGKLEISQMDAKGSLGAAMGPRLHIVCRPGTGSGAPCEGTHNFLLAMKRVRWELAGTKCRITATVPRHSSTHC